MKGSFNQSARPINISQKATYNISFRSYMLSIYNYMGTALVITGIMAIIASNSQAFLSAMYVMEGTAIKSMKPLAWLVMLAPLGLAIALGLGLQRMSFAAAQASFWGFAVVMGLSLSSIFLTYTETSIARVFFITAATFGFMSLYGYTTKRNLSGVGSFLIMGVIGLVIASLVNIFLQSSALQFAVSVIGVLVFTGLTAYDTQKLKHIYYEMIDHKDRMAKTIIIGALTLYLDFINIFMSLMHLLGDRK